MINRREFLKSGSLALAGLPFISGATFAAQKTADTPLLIYGAGAAGLSAALQAARMGIKTMLIEPSPWIGGMLTAAGVSCLDGNKFGAGSGLVQEFRTQLANHYGGEKSLFTGWISLYCYEPHIGHQILWDLAKAEPNLSIFTQHDMLSYEKIGERDRKIKVKNLQTAEITEVVCQIFISADEYGDGLKMANVPYRIGRESQSELGESAAPAVADMDMQDLTYAATLVNTAGASPLAFTDMEEAYWKTRFRCSTKLDCPNPDEKLLNHTVHTWESFIGYAKLPNNKVLLNWPHHSNDYPISEFFFENRYYRKFVLESAKMHTFQFVKYMQNTLGHPEWQLATDEYGTADNMPHIPYIRESRRMQNGNIMVQNEVIPVNGNPRAPFVQDSIAVGDYFIDHHHSTHHLPPADRLVEDYPDNKAFQISPKVLFPNNGDDSFMVGEKSIAVSHIMNGCTRLQPAVILMGQALGTIAALALSKNIAPQSVPIPEIQQQLIASGCQLFIIYDSTMGSADFGRLQTAALQQNAWKGKKVRYFTDTEPVKFEADKPVSPSDLNRWATNMQVENPFLKETLSTETVQVRNFETGFKRFLRNKYPQDKVLTKIEALKAIQEYGSV